MLVSLNGYHGEVLNIGLLRYLFPARLGKQTNSIMKRIFCIFDQTRFSLYHISLQSIYINGLNGTVGAFIHAFMHSFIHSFINPSIHLFIYPSRIRRLTRKVTEVDPSLLELRVVPSVVPGSCQHPLSVGHTHGVVGHLSDL